MTEIHLLSLREEHDDVFTTTLPTGQVIPWRPLSTGDFIEYHEGLSGGRQPQAYLENEIFCKCVLDAVLVNNIGKLKAGIVTTVVATILNYSGPVSIDDLNELLTVSRQSATKVLNDLVSFVCQAFPAYKPEDVFDMSYGTLMLRVAMAERKLLQTGMISEQLNFEGPDAQPDEAAEQQKAAKRRQENSEMMDRYHEQQGIKVPDSIKKQRKEKREKILDHPKPPPLSIALEERTIITTADVNEHRAFLGGDAVEQMQQSDETADVYQDYLRDLAEGKKLTIQTPEERKVAAEARMEKNRLANIERKKEMMAEMKKELPGLLKIREEAKARKKKRAARRRR
jgi:hypothetical protein